jgi:MvdD-like protein with pre-ATP grasp domain
MSGVTFRWALWSPTVDATMMLSHSIGTFQRYFGPRCSYVVCTDAPDDLEASLAVPAELIDTRSEDAEFQEQKPENRCWKKWSPRFRLDPSHTEIYVDSDVFLVGEPADLHRFIDGTGGDFVVMMEAPQWRAAWLYGHFARRLPDDFAGINGGVFGQRAGCDLTPEFRAAYDAWRSETAMGTGDYFDEQGALALVLQPHIDAGRVLCLDPEKYKIVNPMNDPPLERLDGLSAIHATFPHRPAYWKFLPEISAISGVPAPAQKGARTVFTADKDVNPHALVAHFKRLAKGKGIQSKATVNRPERDVVYRPRPADLARAQPSWGGDMLNLGPSAQSDRTAVLIITQDIDQHADLVVQELKKRSVPVIRFEPARFPCETSLCYSLGIQGQRQTMFVEGIDHDLSSVRSVWYMHPGLVQPPPELEPDDLLFATQESAIFLAGMWGLLADRFWVNPVEAGRFGNYKGVQLALARTVGFKVPLTLMTNRPEEVAPFAEACGGDFVYKGFTQPHRYTDDGRVLGLFTNRLTVERLANLEGLRISPGIFQEYVEKSVEIRATVIGHRIFAAEIHSQLSERSKEDWRRYDVPNTPYLQHDLPPDVERKCHELVRALGLRFGCIDLILTPSGEYVFLEINPEGLWYWIERLTGLPLLENFLEMLIQGRSDYATPAPPRGAVLEASAER